MSHESNTTTPTAHTGSMLPGSLIVISISVPMGFSSLLATKTPPSETFYAWPIQIVDSLCSVSSRST